MILGFFRISGHSMLPILKPNDRVLVSSIPYLIFKPKTNDIVLFKHKNIIMIKRIEEIKYEKISVSGNNSSDSLKIEPISRSKILGKVILMLHT